MSERDLDSGRTDFSALGPSVVRARFDEMVAAAVRRGAAELERRRGATGVVRVLMAWRRPVLVLSGLAAAAAMVLTLRAPSRAAAREMVSPDSGGSIADALGIPAGYAAAVEGYPNGGAMP